jgi:molecular chaperone GrpE (heat shock protein)
VREQLRDHATAISLHQAQRNRIDELGAEIAALRRQLADARAEIKTLRNIVVEKLDVAIDAELTRMKGASE